jgi:hypothetical protein
VANWRGTWSSSTAYAVGDSVTYSGVFWLCATANTNHTPGSDGDWITQNSFTGPAGGAASGSGEGIVELAGDLGGTAASPQVTGTHLGSALPVLQGGTGAGSQQAAINALTGSQSSGKYLRSNGTNASLATIQAADLPTLDTVPAPVAAVSLNSQKVTSLANGTAATDAAAFGQVSGNWTAADQGFITWNYDQPSLAAGSGVALTTAGTLYVMAVKLNVAASITNISYYMTTGGSALTSGQCFAALYQGAGGALLGTTADQSTNFAATGAFKTAAISGGPVSAAAGKLYVAFWFNGTTGPSLARSNSTTSLLNAGLATAASRWGVADTGKTTTAPSTLGTITGNAPAGYWVALS